MNTSSHKNPRPMECFSQLRPSAQKVIVDYARRRGITSTNLAEYLDPHLNWDAVQLPRAEEFIRRLTLAVEKQERVLIFGDYDCDGITATAILLRFLHETATLKPMWTLPDRRFDHYGLDLAKAQQLFNTQAPSLLICLDCGTNSAEAIRWLKRQGVDTLVADHHPREGNETEAVGSVMGHLSCRWQGIQRKHSQKECHRAAVGQNDANRTSPSVRW